MSGSSTPPSMHARALQSPSDAQTQDLRRPARRAHAPHYCPAPPIPAGLKDQDGRSRSCSQGRGPARSGCSAVEKVPGGGIGPAARQMPFG